MNAEPAPAHEVIPGLWLGNRVAALDPEFLKQKRIHAVFNCTKDIPFIDATPVKVRIPVDDNLQPTEIRNLELWSTQFVPKVKAELLKGPVLVHCHAGMQRSAAVTAMFLISFFGVDTDTAVTYIQYKRPIAFRPGVNFEDAIRGYERVANQEQYKAALRDLE